MTNEHRARIEQRVKALSGEGRSVQQARFDALAEEIASIWDLIEEATGGDESEDE